MGRITSISLSDHFEDFADKRLSTGPFKNASEVIRAGLRLLEEEENKIDSLKTAIVTSRDSRVKYSGMNDLVAGAQQLVLHESKKILPVA